MSNLQDAIKKVQPKLRKTALPMNASQWGRDGEDHININSQANTELGKYLSIRTIKRFDHPILGHFVSLNSVWSFAKARNHADKIRTLENPFKLREFMRSCGGEHHSVVNFRVILLHSAYLRLLTNPAMMHELIQSELPFDSYVVLGSGLRQRNDYSSWFCRGYEEIRRALKEQKEPNLRSFFDTEGRELSDIYIDLLCRINGGSSEGIQVQNLDDWILGRWENYVTHQEKKLQKARKEQVMGVSQITQITSAEDSILPRSDIVTITKLPVEEGQPTIESVTESDGQEICTDTGFVSG